MTENPSRKGTLELLCGPQGVGKTSSLEGVVRSYRWTTRPIRNDERERFSSYSLEDADRDKSELIGVDGRLYTVEKANAILEEHGIFESKYGGSFVTEERFEEEQDNLCGTRRFPHPKDGNLYAFNAKEIRAAIKRGETVKEQIVLPEVIAETEAEFSDIPVKKTLYLAFMEDIIHCRYFRDFKRIENEDEFKRILEFYMQSRDWFDDVVINHTYDVNFDPTVKADILSHITRIENRISEIKKRKHVREKESGFLDEISDRILGAHKLFNDEQNLFHYNTWLMDYYINHLGYIESTVDEIGKNGFLPKGKREPLRMHFRYFMRCDRAFVEGEGFNPLKNVIKGFYDNFDYELETEQKGHTIYSRYPSQLSGLNLPLVISHNLIMLGKTEEAERAIRDYEWDYYYCPHDKKNPNGLMNRYLRRAIAEHPDQELKIRIKLKDTISFGSMILTGAEEYEKKTHSILQSVKKIDKYRRALIDQSK